MEKNFFFIKSTCKKWIYLYWRNEAGEVLSAFGGRGKKDENNYCNFSSTWKNDQPYPPPPTNDRHVPGPVL